MRIWWESLTLLQRLFACVAIPATMILVIQLVLTLIGLGGHEADLDADGDGIPDGLDLDGDDIPDGIDLDGDGIPDITVADMEHGDLSEGDHGHDGAAGEHGGLRRFTFRGIIAFLAVYGWAALAVSRAGRPWLMAVLVGLLLGTAAMVLTAAVMQLFLRLQADGTVTLANAVGMEGEVYLPIPPRRSGEGKVNVVIQETMTECAAVTDEEETIPTGQAVTVIGIAGPGQLIVMRR